MIDVAAVDTSDGKRSISREVMFFLTAEFLV